MLLRRITKHVTDQNWFAVFLDFLIVVVGVFIGIQVSNWNANQSNAKNETQLKERLVNDLKGMREFFESTDEIVLRSHTGWIKIFRALEACEPFKEVDDTVIYALSQYQSTHAPEILRAAFDEMQSTGAFSRLADSDLQNNLTTLYSRLESEVTASLGGRDNQLAAGRIMWKSIPFSFAKDDPYDSEYDTWGTAEFNPLEHCDNLELRGAIWEMVDAKRDWLYVSAESVDQIKEILLHMGDTK